METAVQTESLSNIAEQVLLSCKYMCAKVSFDISKIKKLVAVYQAYRICSGEKLIAFSKAAFSLISLTTDGIVFTNKAFYLHPNSAKETPSNRFAYSNLCNYLITQESERGSVHLQNETADYRIYDSTLIFKNTTGKEILLILEAIQNKLLDVSQLAQEQYSKQVQWVLSLGREEINHGILSARAKVLLDVLSCKASYKRDAVFLIAESIFRLCNKKKYHTYLDSVTGTLSPSELSELRQPPTKFMVTLLSQLSDLDHSFSEEYLQKTTNQIEGDQLKATSEFLNVASVDEPYLHVLAYCQIRVNHISRAQETIDGIRKQFGDSHIFPIEQFKGIFRNRQMLNVYQAICAGKEIDKAWYSLCDSYGLTLLHYALLLKNDAVAEHILTISNSNKLTPLPEDIEISWMYDYTLLVCGVQSKMKERVFLLFDPDMIRLEKEIAKLKIMVAKYEFQLSGISTMQRQCKNRISAIEKNDPFSPELRILYDKKDQLIEEYHNCLNNKLEAEKEVEAKEKQRTPTYNDAVRYYLNNLDRLKKSDDPLAKLLFRLYFEPEFLYSVLKGTCKKEEAKLYKHGDTYFVAPDFAEIDPKLAINMGCFDSNEDTADDLKHDHYSPITPPYGTSWFSVKAHSNVAVLKTEYRALAKKYHPDVCHHPDSNTAMQQITAEYEDLLRNS